MSHKLLALAILPFSLGGCGLWNELNTRVEVSLVPPDALEVRRDREAHTLTAPGLRLVKTLEVTE